MNICDNTSHPKINPTPEPGHIYKCDAITTDFGRLALAVKNPEGNIRLNSLANGKLWTDRNAYGHYDWYDVTDQYCLTKIK